jgi:hypothetical protein
MIKEANKEYNVRMAKILDAYIAAATPFTVISKDVEVESFLM